ncbi:hypothetical protein ASPACDRAFT_1885885 [Aspergillus aculeatus ATCC 16872]|uniref:A to I editase domain-containing protein n=1 Tax=Aspergillus aculeatus (strain ATCC 16872 / CBS 172.66 / WB 5094) TaxID=690307 RepID=A0A1L9X2X6_ASPA1|nr:uncharacterized protein ASPACDRAFT_1885885 [Aspergillus aculeatus ATCC 16872]OJK02832.1 hypothetical protein ASPACDRAFT_1885885 [Aspergillus aculeatus ATCC 16872]
MGEENPQDGLSSRIARLVHTHFDALPARSKPIVRDDGTREWIPMAGMVVVRRENTTEEELTCVAVTSGAKCLAASQLPNCKGLVLHDWHAEVLALRAFNYWVLSEVRGFLLDEERAAVTQSSSSSPSRFIRRRHLQPQQQQQPDQPLFELHPDLKVYMCCTCAPCGDASMELTMAAQEDPTPWVEDPSSSEPVSLSGPLPAPEESNLIQTTTRAPAAALSSTTNPPPHTTATSTAPPPPPPPTDPSSLAPTKPPATLLDGRAHFSKLGIVRRKPARADADSTKSKSCSDKLALRQVSSLLSPETALLVRVTASAYLAGVVLPETEISKVGCERAFGREGRMKGLVGGYLAPSLASSFGGRGVEEEEEEQREKETQEEDASGYRFHPFEILSIPSALAESLWQYGKPRDSPQAASTGTTKYKPGTISAVWVAAPSAGADQLVVRGPAGGAKQLPKLAGSRTGLYESIIGGVKQGSKASAPVVRGASALSRARMWESFREVVLDLQKNQGRHDGRMRRDDGLSQVDEEGLRRIVDATTYVDFKRAIVTATKPGQARARALREAKTVLVPWVPNAGDGDWGLDVLVDANSKKRKR